MSIVLSCRLSRRSSRLSRNWMTTRRKKKTRSENELSLRAPGGESHGVHAGFTGVAWQKVQNTTQCGCLMSAQEEVPVTITTTEVPCEAGQEAQPPTLSTAQARPCDGGHTPTCSDDAAPEARGAPTPARGASQRCPRACCPRAGLHQVSRSCNCNISRSISHII